MKILYVNLDKNPAAMPDIMGLNIQLEISNTMHETCNNLIKYNTVFNIVVMNNENKYALKP